MNNNNKTKTTEALKLKIYKKREEWRRARAVKSNKKNELLSKDLDIKKIRKERAYKILKKEQKRLSKEIKHMERKLNRFFH
jgi:hypothetical protein